MSNQNLTTKQEAFVCSYLQTGNASEAYRQAYDAKGMKDTTIHVKASELLANGKVMVRVNELRQKLAEREVLRIESHLAELKQLRDWAAAHGAYAAAIRAEELRGKIGGFYVDRHEIGGPASFSHMTDEQLMQSIKDDAAALGFQLSKRKVADT